MATTETYKTVVYGNTLAAVFAAIEASPQTGGSVALVTPLAHIGGVIANGLSAIDYGRYGTKGIGGRSAEFFKLVSAELGYFNRMTRVSPVLTEQVLIAMLKRYGVYIRTSTTGRDSGKCLQSVSKSGASISSFTTVDGTTFVGTTFIDCTEEGDLAKMAGVTMVTGREAALTYGETLAGFYPVESTFTPMDCYASPGVLLHGFSPYPSMLPGAADAGVQAMAFRLCLTNSVDKRINWRKPAGYNESLFEYLRRGSPINDPNWNPISPAPAPYNIGDQNGDFGVPSQWAWPDATPTARMALETALYNEQAGWYWFLANDPSVHPLVRDAVNTWGPHREEMTSSFGGFPLGWPKEPYVRNGRRMVGQYVMTQTDCQTDVTKTDNIAVMFYSFDCHINQRLAVVRNGIPGYILDTLGVVPDGSLRQVVPYQVPLRAILPIASECSNLIVVCAASMSSVVGDSWRIDLHKANVGTGAGFLAGYAANTSTPINSVPVATVQAYLDSIGVPRSYTPPS
jgi:hypothetical protein